MNILNTKVSLRNDSGSPIIIGTLNIASGSSIIIWDTIDYAVNIDNFKQINDNIGVFNENIGNSNLVMVIDTIDQSTDDAWYNYNILALTFNREDIERRGFSVLRQGNEETVGLNINHSDLEGLFNDDHTQYLLADGSRPISGDLNLDGYNITNAGTINDVDITLMDGYISGLLNNFEVIMEPTGFRYPETTIVTYNSTLRTITLTGDVEVYYKGNIVSSLVSGWVSDPHPTTTPSVYFLYYDGSNFIWSTSSWSFDQIQIAVVYYGVNSFSLRECHGVMQWQVHQEFHKTIGTYLYSGGDLSNYVLGSSTLTDKRPYISETKLADEDLITILPSLETNLYTWFFLTGINTSNTSIGNSDIVSVSGSRPYYNEFTGGVWQQTLMPNNDYAKIFVVGIPVTSDSGSQSIRYIFVQPQISSSSLPIINSVTTSDINLGEIGSSVPEFNYFAEIVIRYQGGDWIIISVSKITGSKVNQSVTSGGYLSSVSVDGVTITGDGTSGDPLVANISDLITGPISATDNAIVKYDLTTGKLVQNSGIIIDDTNNMTGVGTINTVSITNHASRHLPSGADPLTTAAPVITAVQIGNTASDGTANSFSRSDHIHTVAAGTPVDVTKATASAGTAVTFARSDHKHDITTAAPSNIGTTNSEGNATTLARSNHIHAHGNQTSGTLHAAVSNTTNGFIPAVGVAGTIAQSTGTAAAWVAELTNPQKVAVRKNTGTNVGSRPRLNFIEGSNVTLTIADDVTDNEVDITIASATGISLSSTTPASVNSGTGIVGIGTTAARSDHTHQVATAVPTGLVVGGANVIGTGPSLAMSDHIHALPAFGTITGSFCQGDDLRLSDDRIASGLRTATTVVSISAATAPTVGQALVATSGTGATWQTISSGSGDVVGPSSATDNAIARFDTTTGKLIQDSNVTIDDNGNLYLNANGSSTTTPRIFGATNFSSGEAIRWEFGDGANAIQNSNGGAMMAYSYHTLVLQGNRGTTTPLAFTTTSNIGIYMPSGNTSDPHVVISGIASQTGDLTQWRDSTESVMLSVDASGNIVMAGAQTVDGVDISTHASRHNPGGADALALGTPSTLVVGGSNSAGTATSFVRSDHIHALPAFGTITGSFCQGDDLRLSDDRTASGLRTATTVVSISAATAPTVGQVLRATSSTAATWQTISSGTGDVVGPSSSTDNAIARFDTTTGKLIQNSVVLVGDTGAITGVLTVNGVTVETHASRHLPGGADALTTAAPSSIGTANSEGAATSFARSNHIHNHGNQTTSTHHAVVSSTINGFMPIVGVAGTIAQSTGTAAAWVAELTNPQKTAVRKNTGTNVGSRPRLNFIEGSNVTLTIADDATDNEIDITIASATGISLSSTTPASISSSAGVVGVGTTAARSDHTHQVSTAAPVALVVGGSNVTGTGPNLAMANHIHSLPAFGATIGTFCQGNDLRLSDDRTASGLRTATGIVSISGATAPTVGQVLKATSSTTATWQASSGGLTAPTNPAQDGYVPIANAGDLTYLQGTNTNDVLSWNSGGFWNSAPAKKSVIVEYTLTDDVNNTTDWFTTWRSAGGDTPNVKKSGSSSGIQNQNSCSPFIVPFNAKIKKAVLTLKGAGVQNGTVTYPVIYQTKLYKEGFTGETFLDNVYFSISSSYTVGTFSVASTDYTGSVDLDISVTAGDLLALVFVNGSGASIVGQTRNAFIVLVLEEV